MYYAKSRFINHLEFESKAVRFYDEDGAVLKGLPLGARVEYKAALKKTRRYTYVDDYEIKEK